MMLLLLLLLLLLVWLLIWLLMLLRLITTTMLRAGVSRRGACVAALVTGRLLRQRGRDGADLSAGEVDVEAALVLLDGVVDAHVAAHGLDGRADLAHVADAVVALADDDVQVGLAAGAGVADARAQDRLGLVDELAVQVDRVARHAARRVVLAEDELRGLLVVRVLLRRVPLALVGQRLGPGAVAALVGLV